MSTVPTLFHDVSAVVWLKLKIYYCRLTVSVRHQSRSLLSSNVVQFIAIDAKHKLTFLYPNFGDRTPVPTAYLNLLRGQSPQPRGVGKFQARMGKHFWRKSALKFFFTVCLFHGF